MFRRGKVTHEKKIIISRKDYLMANRNMIYFLEPIKFKKLLFIYTAIVYKIFSFVINKN